MIESESKSMLNWIDSYEENRKLSFDVIPEEFDDKSI